MGAGGRVSSSDELVGAEKDQLYLPNTLKHTCTHVCAQVGTLSGGLARLLLISSRSLHNSLFPDEAERRLSGHLSTSLPHHPDCLQIRAF